MRRRRKIGLKNAVLPMKLRKVMLSVDLILGSIVKRLQLDNSW